MTRRYIVFHDDDTGYYYSTPEFNGDKSEMEAFGSKDSCDKNWPDIILEFKGVNSFEKFKAASERAQGYYHSFLGDYSFPVTYTSFSHRKVEKIGHHLWQVEM